MTIFFEPVLLRLKEQLGLSNDKDVAELLGMAPAAFNNRKKRNTFPEDKLLALAARRPDLNLDIAYILTGERALVTALMGAIRSTTQMVERLGGTKAERQARADVLLASVVNAAKGNLSEEEQLVLGRYRVAPQDVRDAALRVLLDGVSAPKQKQTTISVGSNHGQVVEGGQVNHGPVSFGSGKAPRKKA